MADRSALYSLFLLALIVFKLNSANIHFSLPHHDSCNHLHNDKSNDNQKDECDLCEQAITILIEDFPTSQAIELSGEVFQINNNQKPENYKGIGIFLRTNDTFFARPPPTPVYFI